MDVVQSAVPARVFTVPQVGETVWFFSDDELTQGMSVKGVIVEVGLTSVRVEAVEPVAGNMWTVPLNDPNFDLYFTYESYLEGCLDFAQAEILRLRRELANMCKLG